MANVLSRRSFMQTVGLGGAAVGIAATAAYANEPVNEATWDDEADVLVIGGGGSGCAAALSAAENGASVICLEAAANLGGVSRLCVGSITTPCTSLQAEQGIEDDVDRYLEEVKGFVGEAAIAHAGDDWALFQIQAAGGGASVDWLLEHNIDIRGPFVYPGHSADRMHVLYPNAQAWPPVMEGELEKAGVRLYKSTKCVEYLKDDTGRVIGCRALDANGQELRFKGSAGVVHAAATIDNCTEWKQKVVSNELAAIQCANVFTDGSAFKALAAAGADITEWIAPLVQSVRSMGPGPDVGSMTAQSWMKFSIPQAGAILVNMDGERYVNELAAGTTLMLATEKQPGKRSWMVFDDAVASNFQTFPDMIVSSCPGIGWGTVDDFVENGGIVKADTLEELATLIDIDPEALSATVEAWNAQCAEGGEDEFGRSSFGLDEAGTAGKGIVTGPFYAHGPQHAETTYGTLSSRITTDFEVLDVFGNVVPGLYAVGVAGHGQSPMTGGSHGGNMAWVFTSGRLCGKALATGKSATAELLAQFATDDADAPEEEAAEQRSFADGTYTGSGVGMGGTINVTLEIADGQITVTDISPNNETPTLGGYEAIEDGTFAAQIEEAQSEAIDGIAGATLTSDAIRTAVGAALAQAE